MDIFKQNISVNELSVAEQLLSDHNEGIQQLGQMAETIIQEAKQVAISVLWNCEWNLTLTVKLSKLLTTNRKLSKLVDINSKTL